MSKTIKGIHICPHTILSFPLAFILKLHSPRSTKIIIFVKNIKTVLRLALLLLYANRFLNYFISVAAGHDSHWRSENSYVLKPY